MGNLAIEVKNLSKEYRIGATEKYRTLRESVMDSVMAPFRRARQLFSGQAYGAAELNETIRALDNVSFEVKHGEVVGIIGRNGAGKSTLLKILSRITEPGAGEARLYGRVGALLEVGTGFHQELTGRENIYLNGAILGMKRAEIARKFDEIVDFSGVEKFIDTPVKHYSSGMQLRLAFAVAAHLEPEILVIDEVLAVGDAEFQKKCMGKMSEVAGQGRTVLFVSHQMNAIKHFCQRCLLLNHGKLKQDGKPEDVISGYLGNVESETGWNAATASHAPRSPYFTPVCMYLVDRQMNILNRSILADETVGVVIEADIAVLDESLTFGFALSSIMGDLLFWSLHTDVAKANWPPVQIGHNRLVAWIPPHFLNEGDYVLELHAGLHFQLWISQPGVNAPSLRFTIRGGLSESPYWIIARPGLLAPVLRFEAF